MMRLAVIGLGSIGTRHAKNLRALGCDVLTVDPESPADYRNFEDCPKVDAAIICTPANSHMSLLMRALERGCDVFVEKPLGLEPLDLMRLAAGETGDRIVQVGYQLRFRPDVRLLREAFQHYRPIWARFDFAQRLTEWRPGRDYRTSPSARRELGGGILREASHEIDLMLWMFGMPTQIYGATGNLSELNITAEDYAFALCEYGDLTVEVSLNMFASGYRRRMQAVDFGGDRVEWTYSDDGGRAYVDEMRSFLHSCETREPPECGLESAAQTVRVIAAIESSAEHARMAWMGRPWRIPMWKRMAVTN